MTAADHVDWVRHLPPREDIDVDAALAMGSTLPCAWERRWAERASWPQIEDVDGRVLTSAEVEERSRTVAGRLLASGLRRGDRVVLSAATSASLVVAYIALLRAGLVVVPVNAGYRPQEIARIVGDARPRAAIVDDEQRGGWIRDAAPDGVLVTGVDVASTVAPTPDLGAVAPTDPALLIYTSGTTGSPKGVGLTHQNLLAGARSVELAWRWTSFDHLLLTLPLFHIHGLGVGVNGTLCAGGSMTLRRGFEPTEVREQLERGRHSMFFGVPTMYQRLVEADAAAPLRRLRLFVSGSAPLPATLAEQLREIAGVLPLERYGMSETGMLVSNPCDGPRRAGSVGWPLPGVRLRLDEYGEVQVAGPNVIDGYWNQPEATGKAFTSDGWFRTGDLARVDGDGRIWLVGRSKELIISGGYNVYPREVEDVLLAYPGVREAAVVGRPSERWGEEVTAFLVVDEDPDRDAVIAFAAERLAAYKVPKQVILIDQLPVNAMGKVVRSALV